MISNPLMDTDILTQNPGRISTKLVKLKEQLLPYFPKYGQGMFYLELKVILVYTQNSDYFAPTTFLPFGQDFT